MGLVGRAADAAGKAGLPVFIRSSWSADAPFRETSNAIEAPAAACWASKWRLRRSTLSPRPRAVSVLCIAHVTNTMGYPNMTSRKAQRTGVPRHPTIVGSYRRRIETLSILLLPEIGHFGDDGFHSVTTGVFVTPMPKSMLRLNSPRLWVIVGFRSSISLHPGTVMVSVHRAKYGLRIWPGVPHREYRF
jgi:hypothetical protein